MKRIALVLIIAVVALLSWYLFIKPFDYLITFKIKANTGTINQSLKVWNLELPNSEGIHQHNLENLEQITIFNDSTFILDWKLHSLNDTISKVKVYISGNKYSLKNRITIPFVDNDFKKRSKSTVIGFTEFLKEHLNSIRIKVVGVDSLSSTFAVYASLKKSQFNKARGMMEFYPQLTNFIAENSIELNGQPFIEIMDWDMDKDSIEYNFCFPIKNKDSLPVHKYLKYKQVDGFKALKAIYNGNYITSDRAWYALMDYAKNNNIEVSNKPVEVFYNNPNMGGDAMQWKAEVYMPIK